MVVAVLHALWLHGRYKGDETCREVLNTPFAGSMTPITSQNDAHRKFFDDFLATPEADETVRVVLARYGSRAER